MVISKPSLTESYDAFGHPSFKLVISSWTIPVLLSILFSNFTRTLNPSLQDASAPVYVRAQEHECLFIRSLPNTVFHHLGLYVCANITLCCSGRGIDAQGLLLHEYIPPRLLSPKIIMNLVSQTVAPALPLSSLRLTSGTTGESKFVIGMRLYLFGWCNSCSSGSRERLRVRGSVGQKFSTVECDAVPGSHKALDLSKLTSPPSNSYRCIYNTLLIIYTLFQHYNAILTKLHLLALSPGSRGFGAFYTAYYALK
jgi:hypothetical protein